MRVVGPCPRHVAFLSNARTGWRRRYNNLGDHAPCSSSYGCSSSYFLLLPPAIWNIQERASRGVRLVSNLNRHGFFVEPSPETSVVAFTQNKTSGEEGELLFKGQVNELFISASRRQWLRWLWRGQAASFLQCVCHQWRRFRKETLVLLMSLYVRIQWRYNCISKILPSSAPGVLFGHRAS